MFVYLSKKIAIPNNTLVKSLAWNKEQGYIACGCDGGLLKVLKLETRKEDNVRNAGTGTNLSTNQTLEGHSGSVNIVRWNETYQKLTSSDQNGLIMVWMLHQGIWYEEMINNRNKSVVSGMAWNFDGQKICIVYEDGAIIVGSVDGNRIWGKELKGTHLSQVEWSPDGKIVLFGLQSGEVHVYESGGSFVSKLPLPCMETMMISVRLVSMRWCKKIKRDYDAPSLVIAYETGRIQLMRNESDKNAIVVDTDVHLTALDWNHEGDILAITGKFYVNENEKKNVLKLYDSYGQLLQTLRIPGRAITACSWEGSGLRIALAVDSFIFFANIRPDYKWCYFSGTLAYVFNKPGRIENGVMFWNTVSNEKHVKLVKNLLAITASGDFCVFVTKSDDSSGQYSVILCNAIGSPVDSRYIDLEPIFLTMNNSHVYVASNEAIYSWHFHSPRNRAILDIAYEKTNIGQERTFYIDESSRTANHVRDKSKQDAIRDKITCIAASDKILLIARASGVFQRYLLPQLALTHRYVFDCRPSKIQLNSTSTRLSVIDTSGMLTLYDLNAEISDESSDDTVGKKLKYERRDVWDVKWATDNNEMFAVVEKTRMYIFRDLDPEEPVQCCGYMCDFTDLEVKTVVFDEVMQNPEEPKEEFIIQNEVKSLRDTRDLLEKVGIKEATKFIEDNPHSRLWQLLAEAAIRKLDFETAEHAFVKRKDYPGVQFVKKIAELKTDFIRKAEIASYFKDFDEAEKLYLENDRPDLAITLRKQLGDWFRVAQLLKTGVADDKHVEEAWNSIGNYYMDRQKYENAITYYVQGHNQSRIAKCYYMLEDYAGLESLVHSLPENHKMLTDIGSMFASIGLCEQAVLSYLKCNKVKEAIDTCVSLSQWNMAITLAQKHNNKEIDGLLSQYANHLMEENNMLNAVELYRKAHKFLDAARVMYKFIKQESTKKKDLLHMKKMHVLVGILIEEHHAKSKARSKTGSRASNASVTKLWKDNPMLLDNDSTLLYDPWKGAEAYHFLMLAYQQLYEGYMDAAMKTSLNLRDYEDVLSNEELYCLLALSSCANRAFATCSSAFMKLESLDVLSDQQKTEYSDLAYEIFLKHPPKDARVIKTECSTCSTMIPDWSIACPNCNTKFPICVATGRTIIDNSPQWSCNRCRHSALKSEMQNRKCCPLCHCLLSSV